VGSIFPSNKKVKVLCRPIWEKVKWEEYFPVTKKLRYFSGQSGEKLSGKYISQ
jgi:hypothetical protein